MLETRLILRDDKFKESFDAKWNKGSIALMTRSHPDKLQISKIEMSMESSKTKESLFNKGKQQFKAYADVIQAGANFLPK